MRGRRRVRSLYPLPLRAYGNTISDDIRAVLPTIALIIQNFNWLQPNWPVLRGIILLLSIYIDRTRIVNLQNPIYIRTDLRLGNFTDQQ